MSRALLGAAALAAALLASLTTAAAAAPADGRAARPADGRAAPPAGQTPMVAPVVLLNGDRVLVSTAAAGVQTASLLPAGGSGLAGSVVMLRHNATRLVIPLVALPYVGRGLDPRLFNLTVLQHAERDGRLPVTLRYRGLPRVVPGITITHRGTGRAQGYLSPSSAPLFGAALARQLVFDHAHGSYGTDGLFAEGLSVSLPGGLPVPVRPAFPMHTLTVTGTDQAGQADTGDLVMVFSIDDLFNGASLGTDNFFYHGAAKYSLPSGRYWAIGDFMSFAAHGGQLAERLDVLPEFTVTGTATVHLSARAATSKITMVTPRPAVTQSVSLTIVRGHPQSLVDSNFEVSGGSLWINPTTRRPADGDLRIFTSGQLTSPPGPGIPYGYSLDFVAPRGIIPPQRYVVRPSDLATVSERYYQDVPSAGGWASLGGTAFQFLDSIPSAVVLPLRLPGRQVQYLSAKPALFWQSQYAEYQAFLPGQTTGGQFSAFRLLQAGQRLTENWNRYPLHEGPNVFLSGAGLFDSVPSAVRAGNTLVLDVTPFSDNQGGHLGSGFSVAIPAKVLEVTGSYALYQNGVKIAGADVGGAASFSGDLFLQAKLSASPSVIRFVVSASRAGKRYPLSGISRDVWTWRSRRDPGATVPPPWFCGVTRPGGPSRHCAVQPMLTLGYQAAGLSLAGTTKPGPQVLTITVAHLQQAAAPPITHTRVQVSFNGGKTWLDARVRRAGAARFRASFTAGPAQSVSLRITAGDAGGNTLTETTPGAYHISA